MHQPSPPPTSPTTSHTRTTLSPPTLITPSLTLALIPHHNDLDFITPEPLNVYPPDNAEPPPPSLPPPRTSPPPPSTPPMLMLTDSPAAKSASKRLSPRLVVEEAGIATGKCGRSLLVKLPDTVVSEKKACELARVCLEEADFSVRCLRSSRKVVIGSPSRSPSPSPNRNRNRKRKREEFGEVSEGKVLRLEYGGNVGRSEGRSVDRSSMAENRGKLGLRHSPRLTMVKNGSRSLDRSSMRDNVGRNKGKKGVKNLPRSSMSENRGKLG